MKQRNILPLFLALAIPCALPAKEAAPAIEPAAKALLEESVKAVGGKDALLKIKSRVIEAEFAMPAQGITMKMKIKQKSPEKMVTMMEAPGMTVEQGYDGKTAWAKDPIQGVRKLAGAELEQAKEAASISPELQLMKDLTSAKLLEDVVEAGKTLKVIKVTAKGTPPKTLYLDKETKLLAKMTSNVATGPDGEMEVTTFMSDYKELDGIKYPSSIKMKTLGQDIQVTYSNVEHNVELDDAIFALPE